MRQEIELIGGNSDAFGSTKWADHILNVRYRQSNLDFHPPETFLSDSEWIQKLSRYMLFKLEEKKQDEIEQKVRLRSGNQEIPATNKLFRTGSKPVVYTPEHNIMQKSLFKALEQEYGVGNVWLEKDFVDVCVETDSALVFYEIKTDLCSRSVIRQALGQILEYAYHPARTGRRPDKLVIVGRRELNQLDKEYLEKLSSDFSLPLSYRVVCVD